MNNVQLRFADFPQDDRVWHLDGLGALSRDETGFKIGATLSPTSGEGLPSLPKDLDNESAVTVPVHVGLIPLLKIGSFWRKGIRIPHQFRHESTEWFSGINVSPATTHVTILGRKFAEHDFLVPPFAHRLNGGQAWRAKCLCISYNNDPYGLVLPMAEAIRFYYARSASLARAVFSGAFEHDANGIYNREYSGFVPGSKRMVVNRRYCFSDDDAWVIGRILGTKIAEAGVNKIHASAMALSIKNYERYPVCDLPFEGAVRWYARAVPIGHPRCQRWLILELIRCSAAFPYEELQIIRDNDGREGEEYEPPCEKPPAWPNAAKTRAVEEGDMVQSTLGPSTKSSAIKVPLAGDQFLAISGKKPILTEKKHCKYKAGSLVLIAEPKAGRYSGGDPSGADTGVGEARLMVEGVDEAGKRSAGIKGSLEGLSQIAEELSKLGVNSTIRTLPDELAFVPLRRPRSNPAKLRRQWAFLNSTEKTRRAVMAVDIQMPGGAALLVEFQQRPKEQCCLALYYGIEVTNEVLRQLLADLGRVKGRWKKVPRIDGLQIRPFNHTRSSYAQFAAGIHAWLLSNLGAEGTSG